MVMLVVGWLGGGLSAGLAQSVDSSLIIYRLGLCSSKLRPDSVLTARTVQTYTHNYYTFMSCTQTQRERENT